jgi:hypothetical protein
MRNTARTAGSVPGLPPAVARPVPHHGVAWAEHLLGPVVQLEDHLTGQDHLEVDRVSGMHPRVVRLRVGQQARQLLLHLRQRRPEAEVGRSRRRPRRDGEEPETIAAYGREVAGLRSRAALVRKGRCLISAPQAVELRGRLGPEHNRVSRDACGPRHHCRMCDEIMIDGQEYEGKLSYIEHSYYSLSMRSHIPRAKIRSRSPVLAVVLLAILVMGSAVLGWLGGVVAWLIVLGALAVFAFCLRARP